MNRSPEPEFFTPEEISEMLKVSSQWVVDCLNAQRIQGQKFGRLWRISAAEVERIKREGVSLEKERVEA